MLNLILTESAVERVPKFLWTHPAVSKRAKILKKEPGNMLLDRSYHHRAMLKLKNSEKRGRPDIVHFCLLDALGSPLNKENMLRTIVQTLDNRIIYLNSKVRLPRNYDRFVSLIEQLYVLGRIGDKDLTLLELSNGGLKDILEKLAPSYIVAFTRIGKHQTVHDVVHTLNKTVKPLVFVGAFPKGHFSNEIKETSNELVSIDPEMLDAWIVTSRLIYEYECSLHLPEKRLGKISRSF